MVPAHQKWGEGFARHLASGNVLSTRPTSLYDSAFRFRATEDEGPAPGWAEVRGVSAAVSSRFRCPRITRPIPARARSRRCWTSSKPGPNPPRKEEKVKRVRSAHKDRRPVTGCLALILKRGAQDLLRSPSVGTSRIRIRPIGTLCRSTDPGARTKLNKPKATRTTPARSTLAETTNFDRGV